MSTPSKLLADLEARVAGMGRGVDPDEVLIQPVSAFPTPKAAFEEAGRRLRGLHRSRAGAYAFLGVRGGARTVLYIGASGGVLRRDGRIVEAVKADYGIGGRLGKAQSNIPRAVRERFEARGLLRSIAAMGGKYETDWAKGRMARRYFLPLLPAALDLDAVVVRAWASRGAPGDGYVLPQLLEAALMQTVLDARGDLPPLNVGYDLGGRLPKD